jgi:hypothetical protein
MALARFDNWNRMNEHIASKHPGSETGYTWIYSDRWARYFVSGLFGLFIIAYSYEIITGSSGEQKLDAAIIVTIFCGIIFALLRPRIQGAIHISNGVVRVDSGRWAPDLYAVFTLFVRYLSSIDAMKSVDLMGMHRVAIALVVPRRVIRSFSLEQLRVVAGGNFHEGGVDFLSPNGVIGIHALSPSAMQEVTAVLTAAGVTVSRR